MAIIQFLLSIIILTVLYVRMIKREKPSIKKSQAIVPVLFGILSLIISITIAIFIGLGLFKLGWNKSDISNLALRSIATSFLSAGLPEEIGKMLFILLCILIFKPKNVYEYLLIGFGVGTGFTIFEEFLYGSNLVVTLIRLIIVTFHAVLGAIMGSYIGKAKYYKINNIENKNIPMTYVKALLIPVIIHTLYDATNVKNAGLEEGVPDVAQGIAVIIALGTMVLVFIMQIIAHVKIKKDTTKLCEMSTI